MKLEEAELFIRCNNCENCPCFVSNTDEFECDADEYCHDVFREAARTIIAARDARIAELEHWVNQLSALDYSLQVAEMERDEARKYAVEMADTLKMTFETIHQLEKSRSELSDNSVYKRCIEISNRYSK